MRKDGNVGEKTLELRAILELIQLYGPCAQVDWVSQNSGGNWDVTTEKARADCSMC